MSPKKMIRINFTTPEHKFTKLYRLSRHRMDGVNRHSQYLFNSICESLQS